MNIFTKLINWLIKKLGGYTEEELKKAYNDGVTGSNKTHEDTIERMRYWFNKYFEEHTAYLALLNCHNATAAAAKNGTAGVAGAIDTIKAYCKSKGSCDECALYNKNGGCKIHEIPCYWGE